LSGKNDRQDIVQQLEGRFWSYFAASKTQDVKMQEMKIKA